MKLKSFVVEYHHNNSGGFYWMNKEDWKNLVKSGWKITSAGYGKIHRAAKEFKAENEKNALKHAIREWKTITRGNPRAVGCECCGPPHRFDIVFDPEDLKDFYGGEECVA